MSRDAPSDPAVPTRPPPPVHRPPRDAAHVAHTDDRGAMSWRRPVPLIGDQSSAAERAAEPQAWAFAAGARESFYDVLRARRDVRRFRPDPVPEPVLRRVLAAAHAAPSVGQSQPWRFVVVADPSTRQRAGWMADRERLAQAEQMDDRSRAHLLDLHLEGIREAPLGIVVCCDRRVAAAGVLGRATFPDADVWSCAAAVENLWLAARAEGLGVGWVTLFQPDELAELIGLPAGVVTLGWLCIGWPNERPPDPGLERAGWSRRLALDDVVVHERWPSDQPRPPVSRLRAPEPAAVVAAGDLGDALLTPPESMGRLDADVNKIIALGHHALSTGTLVLVVGDHPVADLGVSVFRREVGADVLAAARAGEAMGVVAARTVGLEWIVVDAGSSAGDLLHADALDVATVEQLIADGVIAGRRAAAHGLIVLGEVGIGNTTVAAALAAALTGRCAADVVGRGAGADADTIGRKVEVVTGALARARAKHGARLSGPTIALASLGGPELAYLTGVVLGAAEEGSPIVMDGLATGVAGLVAASIEPAVVECLIAGQRSREPAHAIVLAHLGLEPLLDLRLRAGEGVGAALAAGLLFAALRIRRDTARVASDADQPRP
ncbi:MAG: cob(II)yrinic acid a,c-diamide reductase [Ilumatobacteraceae bacterium]|nr:cob(II)yrinic acid a,c-diamide reductase [Ilumatobacteraceae bacterium]